MEVFGTQSRNAMAAKATLQVDRRMWPSAAPRPSPRLSGSPRSACVGAGMLPPPTHQGREKFVRKHAYFRNACERFHRSGLVLVLILLCVLACSILQEFSPWQLQSTPPFNRI